MKNLIFYVVALILVANIFISCVNTKEDARTASNDCVVYLRNQEGVNLIGISGQRYHPDSIGVDKNYGCSVCRDYGRASKDKNNEYCFYVNYDCCTNGQNFYVRLNQQDTDTLKAIRISGGPMEFYYNTQLKLSIGGDLRTVTPTFTIIK